jgi:hypothetical protein
MAGIRTMAKRNPGRKAPIREPNRRKKAPIREPGPRPKPVRARGRRR